MDSNFSIIITSLINKLNNIAVMNTVSKDVANKDIVVPISLKIKGYDGEFMQDQITRHLVTSAQKGYGLIKEGELEKLYRYEGIVTELNFPIYYNQSKDNTMYGNEVFANRILQFQGNGLAIK